MRVHFSQSETCIQPFSVRADLTSTYFGYQCGQNIWVGRKVFGFVDRSVGNFFCDRIEHVRRMHNILDSSEFTEMVFDSISVSA
jgi:hypothetical protein